MSFASQLCGNAIPSLKDSRGPEIIAAIVVIMVLATLAVVLRLGSRKISAAEFGKDDFLIVLALVST